MSTPPTTPPPAPTSLSEPSSGANPAVAGAKRPVHTTDVFVLSGGGARGAAQVGMLQTLIGYGIRPHALVGVSVGALNAVATACDSTPRGAARLAEKWTSIESKHIFPPGAGGRLDQVEAMVRGVSVFSNAALASLIDDWIAYDRLEELPMPVKVLTTRLPNRQAVFHRAGPVLETLLASAAIPGLFPPVLMPGVDGSRASLHVDGGLMDPLPISGAVDLSPTRVFLLDVTPSPRPGLRHRALSDLVTGMGLRSRAPVDFGRPVDVYPIRLDTGVRIVDFSRSAELVERGAEAAVAALVRGPMLEADGVFERVG